MISPADYDEIAFRIVGGAEERYCADILDRLTRSLAQGGELMAKDYDAIAVLARSNHEALTDLAIRYRGEIAEDLQKAVNEALAASAANDLTLLKTLYPSVAPIASARLFHAVSAQTVQGVQSIVARQNIALAASAEKLWYEVAGDAVTAWTHGLAPIDQILAQSVSRLAERGLSIIDYKSGKRYPVDAAVRRHAISQIGQASGRITESYMTEFGHNLVMTSAHFGARPEHEVWQGRAFSLAGREVIDGVTYPDFYKATGYGTVSGMQGVNCRHSWGPFYPGISKLPNIEDTRNGMTSEQYYKATQKQRSLERSIRDKKRDIDLYDKAGLDTTQLRLELGNKQRQLKNFVDDKQLVRDPRREKAYGIGMQPRALRSDKHRTTFVMDRIKTADEFFKTKPKSIEMGIMFDKNDNIIRWYRGTENIVRFSIPAGYKASTLHFSHTHPSEYGGTFSPKDIESYTRAGLRKNSAVANEGTYTIEKIGNTSPKKLRSDYREFHSVHETRLKDRLEKECLRRGIWATAEEYAALDKEFKDLLHEWLKENVHKYGYRYGFSPRMVL